jgi:putative Ca2+/H+ antiporter (TMEM165/GDT1 family)
MNFTVFLSTFGIIFLAELGDKTQLTAIALATKHNWKKVFLGAAVAFVLLNLGAVLVGKLLFEVLPVFWIKIISGGLFLYFGVVTLLAIRYDACEEEAEEKKFSMKGPLVTAFLMILIAELGDKTQIVTASLAAQHNAPIAVFSGSAIALWSSSLMGIFLGCRLTSFIPISYIHKVAGCMFIAFGAVVFYHAFAGT